MEGCKFALLVHIEGNLDDFTLPRVHLIAGVCTFYFVPTIFNGFDLYHLLPHKNLAWFSNVNGYSLLIRRFPHRRRPMQNKRLMAKLACVSAVLPVNSMRTHPVGTKTTHKPGPAKSALHRLPAQWPPHADNSRQPTEIQHRPRVTGSGTTRMSCPHLASALCSLCRPVSVSTPPGLNVPAKIAF